MTPLAAGQGDDDGKAATVGAAADAAAPAVGEASAGGLSGRSVIGRFTDVEEGGVQYDAKAV